MLWQSPITKVYKIKIYKICKLMLCWKLILFSSVLKIGECKLILCPGVHLLLYIHTRVYNLLWYTWCVCVVCKIVFLFGKYVTLKFKMVLSLRDLNVKCVLSLFLCFYFCVQTYNLLIICHWWSFYVHTVRVKSLIHWSILFNYFSALLLQENGENGKFVSPSEIMF